jgi:hypothetical protein
MKKTRRAHLWIGLIASVFIFMESLTGLLMNEPWLIGQSQLEGGRGNFQPGQFNQWRNNQGTMDNGQAGGGFQGQNGSNGNGQFQGQNDPNGNGQFQGQNGLNGNRQFQRRFGGNGNFMPGMRGQGSQGILGTIRSLHEGRIGNMDVKWLIDLVALAMMALTGTGVYLSIKVLASENKRKKRQDENFMQ